MCNILVRTAVTLHSLLRRIHPAKSVLFGYFSYIIIGWIGLCLPWSHQAGAATALDHLFTAASAVSTTGLSTVATSSYSMIGQVIVLLLIQLGGIGYMTFGSFLILSRKTLLPPDRTRLTKTVFSLPESFDPGRFVRSVVHFTIIIESLGVAALYGIFRAAGDDRPLWSAVFHSVSAFCTAGFSLYDTSLEAYAANFWLNAVIGALSLLGAVGFIVCVDYWRVLRGKVQQATLTSRIIIWSTFWLLLIGTILVFLGEPSLAGMSPEKRLMGAFFQVMSAMTTVGFDTVSISGMSRATLWVLILLMVIGASPSGTGGGLKSTTFSALIGVMMSALRGEKEVRFWNRVVPTARVWAAMAGLGFYLLALVGGGYFLELTEKFSFEQNLFEVASALGTVGLSTGITSGLSALGKCIVIFLMYCGRVGPLTFGMALFFRPPEKAATSDEDLAV